MAFCHPHQSVHGGRLRPAWALYLADSQGSSILPFHTAVLCSMHLNTVLNYKSSTYGRDILILKVFIYVVETITIRAITQFFPLNLLILGILMKLYIFFLVQNL